MKTSIEEIVADLAVPHVKRGDAGCLVSVADADRIIGECERRRVPLLGIEGFHQSGDYIVPEMDFIADFSSLSDLPWEEHCLRSVQAAKEYLLKARGEPELLLQFILHVPTGLTQQAIGNNGNLAAPAQDKKSLGTAAHLEPVGRQTAQVFVQEGVQENPPTSCGFFKNCTAASRRSAHVTIFIYGQSAMSARSGDGRHLGLTVAHQGVKRLLQNRQPNVIMALVANVPLDGLSRAERALDRARTAPKKGQS